MKASSVLLEQAARLIAEDHGAHPTTESLENAIRNGKKSLLQMGHRVDIEPYILNASQLMSSVTADANQRSLRFESVSPDIFVMVAGGAKFFEKAVKEEFSRLKVVMPKEPVFLPACGFWLIGVSA